MDPTAVDFDHLDPDLRDPTRAFCALRAGGPVSRSAGHGGFSVVAGYSEVRAAAQEPDVFSSRSISIPDSPGDFAPINADPPHHQASRALLAPHFSPRRVEQREASIRARVTELIDALPAVGACDISRSLTRVVVSRTLFDLIGIPVSDWPRVAAWIDVLIFAEATSYAEGREAAEALQRYLYDLLRSSVPAGGEAEPLIGSLVRTRVEGRALGADTIVNLMITLLYGAIGPSAFAANGALVLLDQDREARRRLIADPGLLGTATEELLRLISPVRSIGRVVARPEPRFGHDFGAGEQLLLVWGAANRDPVEFPEPDRFVPDRTPNRHVAFGAGIHRCLGAHLARLELRVIIGEVLRRIPDYRVDHAAGAGWQAGHMCGINRLPITYPTPRA